MFGIFRKKKTEVETMIERDGIDYAAMRFSELITEMLKTNEMAYQFILEEIEAASQGSAAALKFASNSGLGPSEYKGAMSNSNVEIDGPHGPQQFLLLTCTQLSSNIDLMVELRVKIADNIMKKFSFGKYSWNNHDEIFSQLANLSESKEVKTCKMMITPLHGILSWNFKFSDEELEVANELVSILDGLRDGDFVASVFNIVKH
jgi:hypothetical protein